MGPLISIVKHTNFHNESPEETFVSFWVWVWATEKLLFMFVPPKITFSGNSSFSFILGLTVTPICANFYIINRTVTHNIYVML